MNTRAPLAIGMSLALLAPHALRAQITDPLPAPIDKKGLTVQIRDVVRLPKTLGMFHPDQDVNPAGWARVSFVHDAPDGRRFANDQRGYLYLLNEGASPSIYADFISAFPLTVYNRMYSRAPGAYCCASARSPPTCRTRSGTWGSIQHRRPTTPTSVCSIPAAAIWGSATGSGRTRKIRPRHSVSTR